MQFIILILFRLRYTISKLVYYDRFYGKPRRVFMTMNIIYRSLSLPIHSCAQIGFTNIVYYQLSLFSNNIYYTNMLL